jgi:hypothetical protein
MNKWGKAWAAACLAGGTFVVAASGNAAAAAKPVTVMLDDVPMTFNGTAAQISHDITFVPFRAIAEALGIDVKWDAATKTITATNTTEGQTKTVALHVGKTTAEVHGQQLDADTSKFFQLPIRSQCRMERRHPHRIDRVPGAGDAFARVLRH